ncbi:MAG: fused MFS/spermidine synthase, partial [Acidobacteriota bacterium]|nr:fused MFS/spermidine synthase [Acidobacteriota bacterium]
SRALLIGGAGYGFPRRFVNIRERATIDVVEIDPAMTTLAKRHFYLRDDPRIRSVHADGRIFLNKAERSIYDAVFVDAFNSLFSVPFHLTTLEAVQKIRRTLKQDGVVLVNIGTALEGEGSRFLDAEAATYQAVFEYVEIYRVDVSKPRDRIQNVILAASSRPLVSRSAGHRRHGMLDNAEKERRPAALILTDDLAPVERMISIAQSRFSAKR